MLSVQLCIPKKKVGHAGLILNNVINFIIVNGEMKLWLLAKSNVRLCDKELIYHVKYGCKLFIELMQISMFYANEAFV